MGLWTELQDEKRRAVLSWIGGGIATLAAGAWAVYTYLVPHGDKGPSVVCAQNGIAIGADARGSVITSNVTNGGSAAPCVSGK